MGYGTEAAALLFEVRGSRQALQEIVEFNGKMIYFFNKTITYV